MKIFISGEVDSKIGDDFSNIRNDLQVALEKIKSYDYGDSIKSIAIIPIIIKVVPELEEAGFFQERRLIRKKAKEADYRLRINYDKFIKSDYFGKRNLIISNILQCIREINMRITVGFDDKKLEEDILNILCVKKEELDI